MIHICFNREPLNILKYAYDPQQYLNGVLMEKTGVNSRVEKRKSSALPLNLNTDIPVPYWRSGHQYRERLCRNIPSATRSRRFAFNLLW